MLRENATQRVGDAFLTVLFLKCTPYVSLFLGTAINVLMTDWQHARLVDCQFSAN